MIIADVCGFGRATALTNLKECPQEPFSPGRSPCPASGALPSVSTNRLTAKGTENRTVPSSIILEGNPQVGFDKGMVAADVMSVIIDDRICTHLSDKAGLPAARFARQAGKPTPRGRHAWPLRLAEPLALHELVVHRESEAAHRSTLIANWPPVWQAGIRPTSAQGFHELHAGDEPLPSDRADSRFAFKRAFAFHDFEVTHETSR